MTAPAAGEWVEYIGTAPGWRGVWPALGDRGRVVESSRHWLAVDWLLRYSGAVSLVITRRADVRPL